MLRARALAASALLSSGAFLVVACGALEPLSIDDPPPPPPVTVPEASVPPPRPDPSQSPDAGPDAHADGEVPDATIPDAASDPCEGVVCDAPNGVFACQGGACVTVKCDDGYGDCDGDPTTGCEPLETFYADNDGDGHGDGAQPILACAPPAGYVTSADDCDDGDARAFPGQASYFSTPRADGSFDFDCDGSSTLEHPRVNAEYCICGWGTCGVTIGFKVAVPPCGETGVYVTGVKSPLACEQATEIRAQACR